MYDILKPTCAKFATITYDTHTEQYCPPFFSREVIYFCLNRLAVGGCYVMSARVDMMDFSGSIDFGNDENLAQLKNALSDESVRMFDGTTNVDGAAAAAPVSEWKHVKRSQMQIRKLQPSQWTILQITKAK